MLLLTVATQFMRTRKKSESPALLRALTFAGIQIALHH